MFVAGRFQWIKADVHGGFRLIYTTYSSHHHVGVEGATYSRTNRFISRLYSHLSYLYVQFPFRRICSKIVETLLPFMIQFLQKLAQFLGLQVTWYVDGFTSSIHHYRIVVFVLQHGGDGCH